MASGHRWHYWVFRPRRLWRELASAWKQHWESVTVPAPQYDFIGLPDGVLEVQTVGSFPLIDYVNPGNSGIKFSCRIKGQRVGAYLPVKSHELTRIARGLVAGDDDVAFYCDYLGDYAVRHMVEEMGVDPRYSLSRELGQAFARALAKKEPQ